MDNFPANQQEVVQNKAGVSTQNLGEKRLVWVSELFPLLWGEVLGLAEPHLFHLQMGIITPGLWVLMCHPASGWGSAQQDQVTARGSLHTALAMSTCPGVLATPPLHKVLLTHRTFILTTQQPAMDHSYKKMLAAQNICKIL